MRRWDEGLLNIYISCIWQPNCASVERCDDRQTGSYIFNVCLIVHCLCIENWLFRPMLLFGLVALALTRCIIFRWCRFGANVLACSVVYIVCGGFDIIHFVLTECLLLRSLSRWAIMTIILIWITTLVSESRIRRIKWKTTSLIFAKVCCMPSHIMVLISLTPVVSVRMACVYFYNSWQLFTFKCNAVASITSRNLKTEFNTFI